MKDTRNKQRTIMQIMVDAEMIERARRAHSEESSPGQRLDRLFYFRNMVDPRFQNA